MLDEPQRGRAPSVASGGGFTEADQERVRDHLRQACMSRDVASLQDAIDQARSMGMHFEVAQATKRLAKFRGSF